MKTFLKRICSHSIFTLVLLIAIPINIAHATTASFSASSAETTLGNNIIININVTPDNVNFAEKFEIKFPSNILEVKSFTFANNWIALSQPDYDIIDNVNGVIIKTAGFPSGISSQTEFGTIVFQAKKTGSGNIIFGDKSTAFETNTQSIITGNALPINVKTNSPAVTITPSNNIVTPSIPSTPESTLSTTTYSNLAQVQASNVVESIKPTYIILSLILISLIFYFVFRSKSTNN